MPSEQPPFPTQPPHPWPVPQPGISGDTDERPPDIDGPPTRTSPMTVALALIGVVVAAAVLIPNLLFQPSTASSSGSGSGGSSTAWTLLFPLVWISLGAIIPIIGWVARTYVIGSEEITIDEGVLRRRRRVIPYGRLQQIDVEQKFIAQVFKLGTLTIETAGTAGGTAKLGLLDIRLARGIRRYALQRRAEIQGTLRPPPPPAGNLPPGSPPPPGGFAPGPPTAWPMPTAAFALPETELVRLGPGRLAVAALTHHLIVGAVPALLLAGLAIGMIAAPANAQTPVVVVLLVGAAISQLVALALAALSLYQYVVGRHGYTLAEQGDDLHLRYGLFEVRNLTIPRRRVQHVTVSDNPVRRAMGLVSVQLHSAAPATDGASHVQTQAAFEIPILPRAQLDGLLHALMGGTWHVPPLALRPAAARRRAVVRRTGVLALLLIGPACAVLPGSLALLSLAALGVPWGLLAHRRAGHAETTELIVLARGVFHHRIDLVPHSRLQSALTVQNPMQRLSGLRTLHVNVAGRTADPRLSDMASDVALALARELPRRSVRTSSPAGPTDPHRAAP